MPMTSKRQSARLDCIAMMLGGGGGGDNMNAAKKRPDSPTDSLSPCRSDFLLQDQDKISKPSGDSHGKTNSNTNATGPALDDWFTEEIALPPTGKSQADSGTPSVQTTTTTQQEHPAHVPGAKQSTWTPAAAPTACEPRSLLSRSHRPANISLDATNGASTLPAYHLKQAIQNTPLAQGAPQAIDCTPPPSSPQRGRVRHRRSQATQISGIVANMGNHPSHPDPAHESTLDYSDDRSANSAQRASRSKAARLPRRSSINVFKRFDVKSPLPAEMTGTVIEVPRAATAPNLDGMADEDDETDDDEQHCTRAKHAHRHSAPSPSIPMHPASPAATLTEESAARPISASGTITGRQFDSRIEESYEQEDSPTHLRVSALSPTLPAPSPIPEDSPHKYGLKDRMDTPEAASPPPPDLEVARARRRSSGLAIFHEAKNLQSASSFLNGLSTARRRAESRAQCRNATDNSQNSGTVITSTSAYTSATPSYIHLPNSATTSTIHPYSSISQTALPHMATEADLDLNIDICNRNLGHYFKSSGYAYAPPMSLTQIKCYRSHNRLLPSRNKYAPVECAVCHADDEGQHWSCGWCALRMCTGCRKVLEMTGVAGLRERIRISEMGGY